MALFFQKKKDEEDICPSCGHSHKPGTCCGDCGCCYEKRGYPLEGEEHEEEENRYTVPAFAVSGVLLLFAFLISHIAAFSVFPPAVGIVLSLAVFAFYGIPIFIHTGKEISHREFFTESALMSLSTIGAVLIGEFFEAAAVMFLYSLGEYLSDKAFDRSKERIAMILDLTEKTVRVRNGSGLIEKKPEEVSIGDVIPVSAGEKIAVDGILSSGSADFDTSSVTGESVPVSLSVGDRVLSGYLCLNGSVEMTADRPYEESVASRLSDAVTEAGKRKSKKEHFIRSFAGKYTPAMIIAAFLVFGIGSLITHQPLLWLKKALTLLVISCPCALVLSVPLAYFSSIGAGARIGILFKGGEAVDAAANIGVIAFDKTGTLTEAKIRVDQIIPAISYKEFMAIASAVLSHSSHPLAKAFSAEYPDRSNIMTEECREIPGKGTVALLDIAGNMATACFGSPLLLRERNPSIRFIDQEETAVYASINGEYIGCILFSDTPKKGLLESVASLKKMGVSYMEILSGDRESSVRKLAESAGIPSFSAELLPDQKLARLEELFSLKPMNKTLAYVGDGLNDSPAIIRSDVGIAIGKNGAALSAQAADIVIANDAIESVPRAVRIAKKTKSVVTENIALALGMKLIVAVYCLIFNPIMALAVIADVGVTLLAVCNCLRILKK